MTTEERFIDIVAEQLNVPADLITREKQFIKDWEADSLDILELIMQTEDEFNISILDEDAEKIRTVGDAIDYLKGRIDD